MVINVQIYRTLMKAHSGIELETSHLVDLSGRMTGEIYIWIIGTWN